MVMEAVDVHCMEHYVGAVSFDTRTGQGAFEYDKSFVKKGIELSPLKMPLANRIYAFPDLDFKTFKGLPGLIADSLPDDFGNAVLNAWIASRGGRPAILRRFSDFNIPASGAWAPLNIRPLRG